MDTLISLGTLAAWTWSTVVLLAGLDADTYFEVAAVITTLILLGRWLEARAKRRSSDAIRALLALASDEAARLRVGEPAAELGDRVGIEVGGVHAGATLSRPGAVHSGHGRRTGARRMIRVGHRGAAALAPANTLEAVRAALAAGVDMVEFDVCPGPVVAHDAGRPGPPLAAFLEQLAAEVPDDVELMVDLKQPGYELAALADCRAAGLADRCLFATLDPPSLRLLRGRVRTSFSFSRHDPGPLAPYARRTVAARYRDAGAQDATIRHTLVTPRLVEAVHARGGRVFAWTVARSTRIAQLAALGVDGVVTDDPRLFHHV
jgi:glycerophosphoryl diester phosphodiesterase